MAGGRVLERRYNKLACKCVLNKSDAIVDLENYLGLVFSNSTNLFTSIDSSYLISVYQFCGTTMLGLANTVSFRR